MQPEDADQLLQTITYSSSVDGRTRTLPAHVRAAIVPALIKAISDEREACAALADEAAQRYSAAHAVDEETRDFFTGAETCLRAIITAIRKRGEQP